MKCKIKGNTVTLKKELGRGGEGVVYEHNGKAIKIYHKNQQHLLSDRLAKIADFPKVGVPSNVAAPLYVVYDTSNQGIGFTMPMPLFKGQDIMVVGNRRWRHGVMDQSTTTDLMKNVLNTLHGLHSIKVYYGDFNHNNVLFNGTDCFFIDADASQFGKHRCVVGHELFLDPNLYGIDLSTTQAYSHLTDDYAFAVMLFRSLLYIHPYEGNHKAYKTLLRRAEARHSIMRGDVKVPRVAINYHVLPDELLHYFTATFDDNIRTSFDIQLLNFKWTKCGCGAEHARLSCPECKIVVEKPAITRIANCSSEVIFETKGTIIEVVSQYGLKYVYEENEKVFREDGTKVYGRKRVPNMRFQIQGSSTWVGFGKDLVKIKRESVDNRQITGILGRMPMFTTNQTRAFGTKDNALVDLETGSKVGNILKDRTWFRVGTKFGFGFYQVGNTTNYFVFDLDKGGIKEINLSDIRGRVLDAAAYFDDNYVLFCINTEQNGKIINTMYMVRRDGSLKAKLEGDNDNRILSNVRGKCLFGGRLLCATDDGLVSLKVENNTIQEGTLFCGTEHFVTSDVDIFPRSDGSIYVVSPNRIELLSMEK